MDKNRRLILPAAENGDSGKAACLAIQIGKGSKKGKRGAGAVIS
jgi:hypothetical protein